MPHKSEEVITIYETQRRRWENLEDAAGMLHMPIRKKSVYFSATKVENNLEFNQLKLILLSFCWKVDPSNSALLFTAPKTSNMISIKNEDASLVSHLIPFRNSRSHPNNRTLNVATAIVTKCHEMRGTQPAKPFQIIHRFNRPKMNFEFSRPLYVSVIKFQTCCKQHPWKQQWVSTLPSKSIEGANQAPKGRFHRGRAMGCFVPPLHNADCSCCFDH